MEFARHKFCESKFTQGISQPLGFGLWVWCIWWESSIFFPSFKHNFWNFWDWSQDSWNQWNHSISRHCGSPVVSASHKTHGIHSGVFILGPLTKGRKPCWFVVVSCSKCLWIQVSSIYSFVCPGSRVRLHWSIGSGAYTTLTSWSQTWPTQGIWDQLRFETSDTKSKACHGLHHPSQAGTS